MLDFRTETFLTVYQTMNFTAAAKQLNISQPAVSCIFLIFFTILKSKTCIPSLSC